MKLRSAILIAFIGSISFFNAAIAQTAAKEPFFIRTITKAKYGIKTTIKMPDGEIITSVGAQELPKLLFFINGKSYDEEEVQQLDPTLYNKQQFKTVFSRDREIEGRDLSSYFYIYYIGDPPPLSALAINSLAVSKKYTGKTVVGVVKGPTFSDYNKQLNGFTLESGDEVFDVDITMYEVSRLMKNIIPGDIVIIEVGRAALMKGRERPIITPKTLTKDGEKLMIRGSVQI